MGMGVDMGNDRPGRIVFLVQGSSSLGVGLVIEFRLRVWSWQ